MRDATQPCSEDALRQAQERLQLFKDVSAQINAGIAVDDVIARTVGRIHLQLPHLRVTYVAIDSEWRGRVACSVGPPEMPSIEGREIDLRESEDYLRALRESKPVVIPDVDAEPVLKPFLHHFNGAGSRALIFVPLPHPQLALGLVSCAAAEIREWPEHEISIMTDMAEYLAVAIRQAHIQKDHAAMERQLRDSQKMEAVGRLVGGIAHDFNNLLTAMMIYCGLLATSLGKAHRLSGHVEQIRQAGERGANLVAQLLALSKQQVLEPKIVAIGAVITGLRDMLQRMIGEDIVLITDCASDLRNTKVDGAQLEQVILNLAINARDAMPNGGTLTIGCRNRSVGESEAMERQLLPNDYVELHITDTGHGMDDDTLSRVFEPFFTTKGQGKGTGLGLSTAYGIVRQHGGDISVSSKVGEGTTFAILLPALEAEFSAEASPAAESPSEVSFSGETILLVEDEEMVRKSLVATLRDGGYNVLEASGGEEALRLSGQHPEAVPLMVTDLVMPGMNGRQVADRMAQKRPGMSVLYISGYSDDPRTRKMMGEGMDFVQKPFSGDTLRAKVRQILDRPAPKRGPIPIDGQRSATMSIREDQ